MDISYKICNVKENELPKYTKDITKEFGGKWYYHSIKLYNGETFRLLYFCSKKKNASIEEFVTFISRIKKSNTKYATEWIKRLYELLGKEYFKEIISDNSILFSESMKWIDRDKESKNDLDTKVSTLWNTWSPKREDRI